MHQLETVKSILTCSTNCKVRAEFVRTGEVSVAPGLKSGSSQVDAVLMHKAILEDQIYLLDPNSFYYISQNIYVFSELSMFLIPEPISLTVNGRALLSYYRFSGPSYKKYLVRPR